MTRQEFLSYPLGNIFTITSLIYEQLRCLERSNPGFDIPTEKTLLRRYKKLLLNCSDKFGFLHQDTSLSTKNLYVDKYFNYYLSKYLIKELADKKSPVYMMYRKKELTRDDKFQFVEKAEIFFNDESVREDFIPYMVLELDFMVGRLSTHMNEVCVKYVTRIQEACNTIAKSNTKNEFEAYAESIMRMNKFTKDLRQICKRFELQASVEEK